MLKRDIFVKRNQNGNPLKPVKISPFAVVGEPRNGFYVISYECPLLTKQELIFAFEDAIKELKELE